MAVDPNEPFSTSADELLANNARYVDQFHDHDLATRTRPARRLAIVACMDSRMDIFQILGLGHGDAHIIRNAGGIITDDVVRSLVLSQRLLGTREVILVHHTDCGLQKVNDAAIRDEIASETGQRPWWHIGGFSDPAVSVRESLQRLRTDPFLNDHEHVRGFVYHVDNGQLEEVV